MTVRRKSASHVFLLDPTGVETTAGAFRTRPAHAEVMYAPEVSGRTDGGVFMVADGR